jgi:hypothetical protein
MEFVAKIGGLLVDNANDGCQILQKSSLQARLSSLETDTFGIIVFYAVLIMLVNVSEVTYG